MITVSLPTSSRLDAQTAAKLFGAAKDTSATSTSDAVLEISLGYKVSGITTGALAALSKDGGDLTAASATIANPKNTQDDQKLLSFTSLVLSYSTQTGEITGLTNDMMKEFIDYVTGPDLPPVAPGYPPQRKELGIVGGMLEMQAVNKMTSQQLSDALYGDGLPVSKDGFIDGQKTTFADYITDLKSDAAFRLQDSTNSDLPEDIRTSLAFDAKRLTNDAKGMQEAYDNHTLQFIKATDIPGLNWSATSTAKGYSAVKGAMESGGTENYDPSVMEQWGKDHPNSEWTNYGGVMMVWTW